MDKYLVLSDSVIDTSKITMIYRDREFHNRIWVCFDHIDKYYFEGADGRDIWRFFDKEPDWRDKDLSGS